MFDLLNQDPGELESPPLPPEGGIPKQFVPRWLAKIVQCICLPYVLLDLQAQKIARWFIKPPLVKAGQCKKRGNCCYYVRMQHSKLLNPLQIFWATQINGFYFRSKKTQIGENGKRYYVMGCRHLKKDGSCGNYKLRPQICRNWPLIEYFGHPRLLKGCGFHAKPRDEQ